MVGEVVKPERLRVPDQLAEQTEAVRKGPDRGNLLLVHPHRDELGERPVSTDDPEGRIAGVHQRRRCFGDPAQHHLQVKLAVDRGDR